MIAAFALALLPLQDAHQGKDTAPAWGGFRGNNGSGVAAGSVPKSLDPEEVALWRVEVPAGYSSPVVAGSRLFLTAVDGTELLTIAIDRQSGDELWRRGIEFDGARVGMNSSAAPSPITDGERVYSLFHAAGLVVYDVEGEELWRQDLGAFDIPHGMATSPILVDGKVVQLVDQDAESFLVAFDAKTGKEHWRVERPGSTHSYATPAIYRPAEGPAQIVVPGALRLQSYSAADGKLLWWVDGLAWQTKCVPVIEGDHCFVNAYMVSSSEFGIPALEATWEDELVKRDADGDGVISREEFPGDMIQQAWFIFDLDGDEKLDEDDWNYLGLAGRAVGGLFSIDLTGSGDVTKTHLRWKFGDRRGLPDCPSPLLMEGLLYVLKDGGLLTAIDPDSGEVVKQDRVGAPDRYFASPVGAGGRIVTASVDGQLAVIQGGAEWEVLSVADLEEEIWSTPAIADGQVFVRSQGALWCFQNLEE